jgi:hypothetical protein
MRRRLPKYPIVLAIHPTSRGLGWAAFEGPLAPYDWGTIEPKGNSNRRCLRAVERLFERLRPTTLVLEDYEPPAAPRWPRIVRLCDELGGLAGDMDAELVIYSRAQIQAYFTHLGPPTRYGVAQSVARHVPALASILPKPRQAWEPEQRKLSVFSAAAVALTHFHARSCELMKEIGASLPEAGSPNF